MCFAQALHAKLRKAQLDAVKLNIIMEQALFWVNQVNKRFLRKLDMNNYHRGKKQLVKFIYKHKIIRCNEGQRISQGTHQTISNQNQNPVHKIVETSHKKFRTS